MATTGSKRFPDARELLVTADGGGSNSARCKLWKLALQGFADKTGLKVHVCHFPPGTSKWNKIEHRLFCHITQNWRGQPLTDLEVIVQLIGRTTTREGLRVKAAVDRGSYPKGLKVADEIGNNPTPPGQVPWQLELHPVTAIPCRISCYTNLGQFLKPSAIGQPAVARPG